MQVRTEDKSLDTRTLSSILEWGCAVLKTDTLRGFYNTFAEASVENLLPK